MASLRSRLLVVLLVTAFAVLSWTAVAQPLKAHVLFSGGGIRAEFGAIVAACMIQRANRHQQFLQAEVVVGLSGGSWGAAMLANLHAWDNPAGDACAEMNRVKQLDSWGYFEEFSPVKCGASEGGYWPVYSLDCYSGWKRGVQSLFNNVDTLGGLTFLPQDAPPKVRNGGFNMAQHKAIFDTCYWRDQVSHHDGVCSFGLSTPDMHCVKFVDRIVPSGPDGNPDSHRFDFDLEDAQVVMPTQASDHVQGNVPDNAEEAALGIDRGGEVLAAAMDVYDVLTLSSLAYAEANAVSGIVKALKGDGSRPPVIMTPERNFRGCDAGSLCNLPLSYLATIPHDTWKSMDNLIIFDYSDHGGDPASEIEKCMDFWTRKMGWDFTHPVEKPWGFTFMMTADPGLDRETHHDPSSAFNSQLLVHLVLFRGESLHDDLVKKFPTMSGTQPNYFKKKGGDSSPSAIACEYSGFLHEILAPESEIWTFRDVTGVREFRRREAEQNNNAMLQQRAASQKKQQQLLNEQRIRRLERFAQPALLRRNLGGGM